MVNYVWIVLIVVIVGFYVYRMVPAKGVKSISPAQVQGLLSSDRASVQFVDVREPNEYKSGHVNGFKNIPLSQLSKRMTELSNDKPVVVMCRSGSRSMQAAKMLGKNGFKDIRNASGGIMAYNAQNAK